MRKENYADIADFATDLRAVWFLRRSEHDIEEEAYSTGAAALLPYVALKRYIEEGKTSAEIARHFGVSRALVEFRLKISRLWERYKQNLANHAP